MELNELSMTALGASISAALTARGHDFGKIHLDQRSKQAIFSFEIGDYSYQIITDIKPVIIEAQGYEIVLPRRVFSVIRNNVYLVRDIYIIDTAHTLDAVLAVFPPSERSKQ